MKFRKGLTLIEIIITFALVSILAVVILNIFNISIATIFKSGRQTQSILQVKEKLDKKVKNLEDKTDGEDTITVIIPGVGQKEIKGSIIEEEDKDTGFKINTFVPNKSKKD